MFLYLKRSQRPTWLGGRVYKLLAYIQADDNERRVVQAHRFSEKLAYIVPLDHVDDLDRRADAAWQRQKKMSILKQEDTGKILWENAKVVALSLRASYALHSAFRVTIDDLITGTVIESPNLTELLETESSITKSFDALKRLVEHASAFEQDSETVLEPDAEDHDQLAPPSAWPRYSRR